MCPNCFQSDENPCPVCGYGDPEGIWGINDDDY